MEDLGNERNVRRLTTEEIDALADDIAMHSAAIASATYALIAKIREFDLAKGWARQGAIDCATWLNWRTGVARTAAMQQVQVAHRLAEFPLVAEAFRKGEISYTKVRAVTRDGMRIKVLLHQARGATGAQLERISAAYRRCAPGESPMDHIVSEESRHVRKSFHRDGTVSVTIRVLPDEAERIYQAIRETKRRLTEEACGEKVCGEEPSAEAQVEEPHSAESTEANPPHASEETCAKEPAAEEAHSAESPEANPGLPSPTMADAAVAIFEQQLARIDEETPSQPAAERRQLLVHLREERICGDDHWTAELHDGTPIRGAALARLACDCGLVVAKTDDQGDPLTLGRLTRSVSPSLRRALLIRDRCCQFPGCTQLASLESHHIQHWLDHGPTNKDNLTLVCSFHHHCFHEGGFSAKRNEDGSLTIFDPDGRPMDPTPPPPTLPNAGEFILRNECAENAIAIEPRTNLVRHNGEGLDLGIAVDAILPLEHKRSRRPPVCLGAR